MDFSKPTETIPLVEIWHEFLTPLEIIYIMTYSLCNEYTYGKKPLLDIVADKKNSFNPNNDGECDGEECTGIKVLHYSFKYSDPNKKKLSATELEIVGQWSGHEHGGSNGTYLDPPEPSEFILDIMEMGKDGDGIVLYGEVTDDEQDEAWVNPERKELFNGKSYDFTHEQIVKFANNILEEVGCAGSDYNNFSGKKDSMPPFSPKLEKKIFEICSSEKFINRVVYNAKWLELKEIDRCAKFFNISFHRQRGKIAAAKYNL